MFCPRVLNGNFNCSLAKSFQMNNVSCCLKYSDLMIFEDIENFAVYVYSEVWIFSSEPINEGLEIGHCHSELLFEPIIIIFQFSSRDTQIYRLLNSSAIEADQEPFQNSFNLAVCKTFLAIHICSL